MSARCKQTYKQLSGKHKCPILVFATARPINSTATASRKMNRRRSLLHVLCHAASWCSLGAVGGGTVGPATCMPDRTQQTQLQPCANTSDWPPPKVMPYRPRGSKLRSAMPDKSFKRATAEMNKGEIALFQISRAKARICRD